MNEENRNVETSAVKTAEISTAKSVENKKATGRPLSKTDKARLAAMNKHLYPAHLGYRADSGSFRFEYHRDGHSVRRSLGFDLEMAYERALVLRREIDGSSEKVPVITDRKINLSQWHERWRNERISKWSAATAYSYAFSWKQLAALHDLELGAITREQIRKALMSIEKESSREHAGVFIGIVLRAAAKVGLTNNLYWSQEKKRKKRAVHILSNQQLEKVFECASPMDRPMFALAGFLGLRREEIFGLKPRDIDLANRLIFIERTRVHVSGKGVVEQPRTKNGDIRVLPLPEKVVAYIEPILSQTKANEYLFPVFRHDLPKKLRCACARAGIQADLTLHDLRHICGSNLMMSGGLAVAQAVLGHRDIGTTADIYGHLTATHLARFLNGDSVEKSVTNWDKLGQKTVENRDFSVNIIKNKKE